MTVETIMEALRTRVRYETTIEPEEDDPEGLFATDEPERDAEDVASIRERISGGDTWAWCIVTVRCYFRGLVGRDTLGACSYASQEEFEGSGDYYDDMKDGALRMVAEELLSAHATLRELGL